MYSYKVGDIIPDFIGRPENPVFDIDDSGATMVICFNRPTVEEIAQFESGKPFEIRFTTLKDIIFISVKIGKLNWMDMPYTPHLSQNLTKLEIPNEGQGLALTVFLVDCSNGQIKHIRLLGLSEKFTRPLFGEILELKMKPFDRSTYMANLQQIYNTYPTKKIVELSNYYCKF